MAEEWFYTTNKQQMGPVTWKELVELAEVGILKPHDMVWTEGMDEWVKAINKNGLFSEGADDAGATAVKKKSSYTEPKPPPGRRSRPKEEDEEDDEEEGKEAKKAKRKSQEDRAKMAIGLKVGLILGGVLLALLFGVGCVGGIVWISFSGGIGGDKGGGDQKGGELRSFTTPSLPPNKFWDERRTLQKGKRLVITSNINGPDPKTRIVIHVLRGNDQVPNERPVIADDVRPNNERNGRVEFQVPDTDVYRLRILNRGPGNATATINIEER